MKHLLIIIFLVLLTIPLKGQDAATLSQRATQQYVLFESEKDKGADNSAMYDYLYQSYTLYMRLLDSPGNSQFIDGAKNRLTSMYPILLNGAIYFTNQGNAAKSADMGTAYIMLPKHKEYINAYLAKDESYPQILYNTAVAAYNLERFSNSIDFLTEYLSSGYKEQEKDCYVFLNMIYNKQKDYPNQEQILKEAVSKFPLTLDFYYNLVNIYIATKNSTQLLVTIDNILKVDPNDTKVLPIKARMLESQGKNLEALAAYKKLLSFSPTNFELITGVARCNFKYATQINNDAANISEETQYQAARQRAIPYLMEAQTMFLKILESEPSSKMYMQGLLGVYQYLEMKSEYAVLKKVLEDGATYTAFQTRLLAYNRENSNKARTGNNENVPVPTNPAVLLTTIKSFTDANNNNIIDAGEGFSINFSIENKGLGDAYNVRIRLTEQGGFDTYLEGPKELDGGHIPAGTTKEYSFRYTVNNEAPTSQAKLVIYAFEANGFDADPANMEIFTQELSRPILKIADYQFLSSKGTSITLGDNGNLNLAVQNVGTQTAYNVKLEFKCPKNIMGTDIDYVVIDSLAPGEARPYQYNFLVNKRFSEDSVAVNITIAESTNSSFSNETYKMKLGDYLTSASTLKIEGQLDKRITNIEAFSLTFKSELMENVPVGSVHPNRYALIIGNEDYSMVGANAEINVPYAVNDAMIFKEYCNRTFGIPNNQIKIIPNATTGMMHEMLDWLINMASTNKDAELFFYYSGHGSNDEASKEPYLLPIDITGKNIRLGISIKDLYKKLCIHPIKGAYVFLDACFSGGYKSNAPLIAQKGIRVVPKFAIPNGKILSFASSSGDQTSSVFHEKKQGYYTYYLIKTLQDNKGDLSMTQLFNQTRDDVKTATALLGKMQEPQVLVSPNWDNWSGITLKKNAQ